MSFVEVLQSPGSMMTSYYMGPMPTTRGVRSRIELDIRVWGSVLRKSVLILITPSLRSENRDLRSFNTTKSENSFWIVKGRLPPRSKLHRSQSSYIPECRSQIGRAKSGDAQASGHDISAIISFPDIQKWKRYNTKHKIRSKRGIEKREKGE